MENNSLKKNIQVLNQLKNNNSIEYLVLTNKIPNEPGIYMFKDSNERLLYVGKSKKLKNRVKSYFRKNADLTPRIKLMVKQVIDIEYIVTDTESEALTLESNLIKEYQPYFNVLLKDDKKYPYICITWSEEYPRIFITRRRRNRSKGDRYYGPYVDVGILRTTLFNIKRVFPIRQRNIPLYKDRACLNYSIGRCPGVCQEYISSKDYQDIIKKISMVFQGRVEDLSNLLIKQMEKYSNNLNFEKAAQIRDQIKSLQVLRENQKMILPDSNLNIDVFAISNNENLACIQLFQMRAGKLVGRLGFSDETNERNPIEILQKIIVEYYSQVEAVEIPKEVLVQHNLPKHDLINEWLSEIKNNKVNLVYPKQGMKRDIINLVYKNSNLELDRLKNIEKNNINSLEDISCILELSEIPRRIEAYDISHIQGSFAVASQVVFINGIPAKHHYRRYKIKSSSIRPGHSDDFMALAEVIRRRFKKWSKAKKEGLNINEINTSNKSIIHTEGLNDWPDLILIDGGKGQLSSSYEVLRQLDLKDEITICSLAKQKEDLYIPNQKDKLQVDANQPGMILLRRLRDEAHRFAISYHRSIRNKSMKRSRLGDISGIGNHLIKGLLTEFKSIEAIKLASVDDLSRVDGVGRSKANKIWKYFNDFEN